MSFFSKPIKKLLELKTFYKCGILNYLFNSEISYQEYDFVVLLDSTLTLNLIDYFHNRKLEVFSYGIIKPDFPYANDVFYIVDDKMLKS